MNRIISPKRYFVIALAALFAIFALSTAANFWLWAMCLMAVPALMVILGGRKATPVFLFTIGISWLQIAAILMIAQIGDVQLSDVARIGGSFVVGNRLPEAVFYSLIALLVLATGIRSGELFNDRFFGRPRVQAPDPRENLNLRRVLIAYGFAAVIGNAGGNLAYYIPTIAQFLLVWSLVKFVFVFLIAAIVIETRRGYFWLLLVALFEVASGSLSFFSQFKEAIFIILIAVIAARRALNVRLWIFAAVAVVGIIWMSLVWTLIKDEYRKSVVTLSLEQKTEYLLDKYFGSELDYGAAAMRLLDRVQYVSLFSLVIDLDQQKRLPQTNYYLGAINHVLSPRLLFPDKAALSDSEKTTRLTGMRIAANTSIGVGYVAEAYADFGFPKMLLPIFGIGMLLGLAGRYFMTRPVHPFVQHGFAAAALFTCFQLGANIDKSLGMFIVYWIVMAGLLRFGYPLIAPWLRQSGSRRRVTLSSPFPGRRPG